MVFCHYIDGCKRRAYYGEELGKPIFCSNHNDQDWCNVVRQMCQYIDGCKTRASYGLKWGNPIVCKLHNEQNWDDVRHPKCKCGKVIPIFGMPGEKPTCCKDCRTDEMEDVVGKRCKCGKCRPTFGNLGEKPTCCKDCRTDEMEDVINKKCKCGKIPTFGKLGEKAVCCRTCREPGMVNVSHKRCKCGKCRPNFGMPGEKAVCCEMCREPGMMNVVGKRCLSCGLFIVKRKPHLCSYCNPSKRQKTREMTVKKLLESASYLDTPIHDKPVGGECGKYRPDFLYDAATHRVVVEVDEDQHDRYDHECERIRMINITEAVGMRCVFIRYNPDTFRIDGKEVAVPERKRHELLLKTVCECMKPSFDPEATADVIYLYYDGAEVREENLV